MNNNINESDINKLINLSIETLTSSDFASVLYKMYGNEYYYSKNNGWYYFENHIWRKSSNASILKNKISNELSEKYIQLSNENKERLNDSSLTNEERNHIEKQNDKILSVIAKLCDDTFIESIIFDCKNIFYDKNVLNQMDENQFLMAFNNGVYDLKNGKFREGTRDDYISLCTGINKIDFSTEHPEWNELNKFISTIFPNEEQRNYFMTYLSTCLVGLNFEQKFRLWIGDGANGKSKLEELFTTTLGDYAIKFPVTLITTKRSASNQISPELVRAKGKRFAYFVEPAADDIVNSGIIKEFTGNDKIYARGLNQDSIEFVPQFKMALLCNDVPNFSQNDIGLWSRLEIVKFTSRFVENPNPENPNEFLRVNDLSEKMKSWKELFMAYLIDVHYTNYRQSNGESFVVPKEVKDFTQEMREKKCI